MTKPKIGATSKKGETTKRRMLEVEDADTLEEFQRKAKKVYEENNPFSKKKKGRRPYQTIVLRTINDVRHLQNSASWDQPSQGKIIEEVKNRLVSWKISEDTIRRYVKIWRLAEFKDKEGLSAEDWEFLKKNKGSNLKIFDKVKNFLLP